MHLARLTLIALAMAAGCSRPPKQPSAVDLATAAVNLTDEALAFAIDASPPGNVAEWRRRVALLDSAKRAVEAGKGLCTAKDDLSLIASLVSCGKCLAVIEALESELKCP